VALIVEVVAFSLDPGSAYRWLAVMIPVKEKQIKEKSRYAIQ
jgi:hypothetical protein